MSKLEEVLENIGKVDEALDEFGSTDFINKVRDKVGKIRENLEELQAIKDRDSEQ